MDEKYVVQLKDGRVFVNDAQGARYEKIVKAAPEKSHPLSCIGYSWDERGLSDLFSEIYMHDAKYCPETGCWYVYLNGAWRKDIGNVNMTILVEEYSQLLILYATFIENEERRNKYLRFLGQLGDIRLRDRILRNAESKMTISASMFDADPYLINCLNGTYDLKSMTFKEHTAEDYLTMQTNFGYTLQKSVYPRWTQFITEVTQGDNDKAEYLQKALGYSMLGLANEECMFILHGKTTRNGKSTLLNAVHHLLGDYAAVASVSLICKSGAGNNPNAPTPALASLKGKRFVTMAESNQYGKLDEEAIKQLTGGEEISARPMYARSVVSFLPQFTLWLSCNDLPSVRDKSVFSSDRLRVIEFNRHFSEQEREKSLKNEFRNEEAMRGIFSWLVSGYALYRDKGLQMPESMKRVVRQYEKDNDLVLQFLEEKCERADCTTVRKKSLYDAFKIWLKSNGYTFTPTAQKFNKAVESHPEWYTDNSRTVKGYLVYDGLKLRE